VCAAEPPRVTIEVFGALSRRSGGARIETRASRLEGAFAAAGLALDGRVVAAINGTQIVSDPWYPLGPGDRISLIAAHAGD
jgi:hypothetical protein